MIPLTGALIAYAALHQPWWYVAAGILVPDLTMGGYLAGTRPGAQLYNLGHTTLLPAVMVLVGCWRADPLVAGLGLIWVAHIGMDRLLGYGLKYNDRFAHTHLSEQYNGQSAP